LLVLLSEIGSVSAIEPRDTERGVETEFPTAVRLGVTLEDMPLEGIPTSQMCKKTDLLLPAQISSFDHVIGFLCIVGLIMIRNNKRKYCEHCQDYVSLHAFKM